MGDRGKQRCCPSRTNGKERCGVDESVRLAVLRRLLFHTTWCVVPPAFTCADGRHGGGLTTPIADAVNSVATCQASSFFPESQPSSSSRPPSSLSTQRLDRSRTVRFPLSPQLRPLSVASHGGQKHRQDDAGLHHLLDGNDNDSDDIGARGSGGQGSGCGMGEYYCCVLLLDLEGSCPRQWLIRGELHVGKNRDAEAMGSAKKASRGLGVAIDKHTRPRTCAPSLHRFPMNRQQEQNVQLAGLSSGSPPANAAAATTQPNGSARLVQMCPSLYRAAFRGRTEEVMALLLQQRYGAAARTERYQATVGN
ncbi:hypothetical protein HU200_016830 [Digitaria exilis]|uniref:Uncharacterized protein n=1 Tax=Digitaria exilis TaxID=1010633 RepID=A0A835F7G4_9POAL|nr:hypothetical protein HU200_016830 [Digitaria exilis]